MLRKLFARKLFSNSNLKFPRWRSNGPKCIQGWCGKQSCGMILRRPRDAYCNLNDFSELGIARRFRREESLLERAFGLIRKIWEMLKNAILRFWGSSGGFGRMIRNCHGGNSEVTYSSMD